MSIRPLPSKGLLSTISFSGSGRMDYYLENNLKLESSFNRVAAMRNGKIVISCAIERSTEVRAKLSEVTVTHAGSQELRAGSASVYIAQALVVGKEKQLVLDNGAANSAAKRVVAELRFDDSAISRVARDDLTRNIFLRQYALRPSIRGQICIE